MAANSVDGRNVQVDVRELFNLLESNQLKTVDEITEEIQQHLSAGGCIHQLFIIYELCNVWQNYERSCRSGCVQVTNLID